MKVQIYPPGTSTAFLTQELLQFGSNLYTAVRHQIASAHLMFIRIMSYIHSALNLRYAYSQTSISACLDKRITPISAYKNG